MPIEIKIYFAREVAEMPEIRLTARQVRNLCIAGKFNGAYRLGRKWMIPEQGIEKFLCYKKIESKKAQRDYLKRSLSIQELKEMHKNHHPRG